MAKKILLVDDDMYIRELYEEVLKEAGYEVETAQDGEEGLAKLLATHYDLILLDVMMPKLDGLGVLTKMKENPQVVQGPVVILTSLAHDAMIKQLVDAGQVTHLVKTDLTPDQLLAKIQALLPQ